MSLQLQFRRQQNKHNPQLTSGRPPAPAQAAGLKHIGFGPFKRENQDEFFIQVGDFGGVNGGNLFCVFDGHGTHGKDAALYSRQLLPRLLDVELREYFMVGQGRWRLWVWCSSSVQPGQCCDVACCMHRQGLVSNCMTLAKQLVCRGSCLCMVLLTCIAPVLLCFCSVLVRTVK